MGQDEPLKEGQRYFSRRLTTNNDDTPEYRIDEADILALPGCKVVLGEPGMGKSALMRELGRQLDQQPVTAVRLISSKEPAKLVPVGKPLLIDGLDEAMSRRESDAVDAILAQLEDAGSPPFVLSCRSREWQSRTLTNLRQLYKAKPYILTLEPLDRDEARAFLVNQCPGVDAVEVLQHLADHNLEGLYQNPLTLGLMGRVAGTDSHLPSTRAALFERVCDLIWPEHDPDRQDEGLAQLSRDTALDAAGAIAAGLLLGGAEAASAEGVAHLLDGDVRLADLEALPAAEAVRTIFSSKLFHSVGPSRAKPIHRVVAEYLGARWLARQAASPRTQRRVLGQLHGSGAVPASLRGLHAWLAFQSPAMAQRIITADPYGLLRYGEAAALTPSQADWLFEALCRLADDDPFFRSADWDRRTAAGLMIPEMKEKIEATIASPNSNGHLRSLLIEGLHGTPLAGELGSTLEAILLSPDRFYRERDDAAEALQPHRDRTWWQAVVATLANQSGEDGPRLARQVIQRIDGDVPDELLVATVFAEMGITSSRWPRRTDRRVHTLRSYERLIAVIPPTRIVGILDLVANYAGLLRDGDWQNGTDVAEIMANLILRGMDHGVIGVLQASSLWRWLGTMERAHRYDRSGQQALALRLAMEDAVRRAVQAYALANDRRDDSVWITNLDLQRRFVGLANRPDDLIALFDELALGDNREPALREDWRDLVQIAWGSDGMTTDVTAAAERFRRGDKPLADFVRKLANPKKPEWQLRDERVAAKRERSRKIANEEARRAFNEMRADLRAGELNAILQPAQAYLNRFRDLPSDLPPAERLASWIGLELVNDALIGFESVLHRTDLPTPHEIADGFARGTVYNFAFPVVAGLYERLRNGAGVADLSTELKQAALLLNHNSHGWDLDGEEGTLRTALEAEVIATPKARQAFARLLIEPALHLGKEHVAGLYMLAHEPEWVATGAALGRDWLTRFPNVPGTVEMELVDCLTNGGALAALRHVARTRSRTVFRDFDHQLAWQAIDVLVRFDEVRPEIQGIGADHPDFIWFLRNRLQFERRGGMLPLTVAQAEWIIAEFRATWPYASLVGSGSGNTNGYDATDFLRALITRIADDTSVEAGDAITRLIDEPDDTYTQLIRHMAAEQRQKRAEEEFPPLSPGDLMALLADGPPGNIDDLKALVLEEMEVVQAKLRGEDLDTVFDFWTDSGMPRTENRCRDRLATMIAPELARYGVQQITEADMPKSKRADLAYARGSMQLPVEVKGQWHANVWDAATNQLDARYLIDWRSEQRGIYCVLWFGDLPSTTGRRLEAHPDGNLTPTDPNAMRAMLVDRLSERSRALINVVVLDLSAGRL